MLIKLNYTTGTFYYPQFFRVLREIINDSTVTSISSLITKSGMESWTTGLVTNLDIGSSYIVRTDSPNNTYTKAHISRPSTAAADNSVFEFVLQQKVYDNSNYYYTMVTTTTAAGATTKSVNSGLTNPMSSSEWGPTIAAGGTAAVGTSLGATGTSLSSTLTNATGVTFTGGATFWAYVTDTCFMFSVSNGFTLNGWPALANPMVATLNGPLIIAQYERRDHWNTSASTILPVVADNGARPNPGLGGAVADFSSVINPGSTTTTDCPLAIYNSVANAYPGTFSSWSVATNSTAGWAVAHGLGSRYSDVGGLNQTVYTTSIPSQALAPILSLSGTQGSKILTSTLTGVGFPLYSLTFRRMGITNSVSTLGGNVTTISKIFIFNGDYLPGDEYIYNSKTYVLWPAGIYGPYNRVAYAIPKE